MSKKNNKEKQKKQHYVPKCYLKSWIDPSIPRNVNGQNIWVFDLDGKNPRSQSPRSTFTEDEMYTLIAPDGGRDLTLEHGLGTIETKFGEIRTSKFNYRRPLSSEEWMWIHLFTATLRLRTASSRDNLLGSFEQIKEHVKRIAPAEWWTQKHERIVSKDNNTFHPLPEDFDNLKGMVTEALLKQAVTTITPVLAKMHPAIICTNHPIGFITTDAPSTWFDPDAYRLPAWRRGVGLKNIDLEITMPLSPKQCLFLTYRQIWDSLYVDVSDEVLDKINRRHIAFAPNAVVASKNELVPEWFRQGPPPEDA